MTALFIDDQVRDALGILRAAASQIPVDMRTLPERLKTPEGKARNYTLWGLAAARRRSIFPITRPGHRPGPCSGDQGRRLEMTINAVTDKQISYILSLCHGSHESHAFAEIAKDMGISTTAAVKRATKQDASITIERLKKGA
jgi:hypothetical protein